MSDVTIVLMTRNRAEELLSTLERLLGLPERAPVIVVDNGSTDGTSAMVAERYPQVELITLADNAGVAARNIGAEAATTPYVAFNDDDSRWEEGSLRRAVEMFERHPRLGALAADIIVEPTGRQDPTSAEMGNSPLDGDPALPGVEVLGFLACAAVVRRTAFLDVGGFQPRLHFGGEEELLAIDLATRGWAVRYVPELRVRHRPSSKRDTVWRRRRGVRNSLWCLWLRRPVGRATRRSLRLLRQAHPATAAGGLLEALRGLPWVLRARRVVPTAVERQLRLLEPEHPRLRGLRRGTAGGGRDRRARSPRG